MATPNPRMEGPLLHPCNSIWPLLPTSRLRSLNLPLQTPQRHALAKNEDTDCCRRCVGDSRVLQSAFLRPGSVRDFWVLRCIRLRGGLPTANVARVPQPYRELHAGVFHAVARVYGEVRA